MAILYFLVPVWWSVAEIILGQFAVICKEVIIRVEAKSARVNVNYCLQLNKKEERWKK